MRKLSFIILLVLSCLGIVVMGQEKKEIDTNVKYVNKLLVLGKYMGGDSVVLRWTAPNYPLWLAVRNSGVDVYRAELDLNTKTLGAEKKLTTAPIKPMTLEEMKRHFKEKDTAAAMAAQVLYGGLSNGPDRTKNMESMDLLEAEQSNRFVYAAYLADLYPAIANALGLRYVDKTITKGKIYVYYLKADIQKIASVKLEESSTVVNTSNHLKAEPLKSLDALGLDKSVRLFWNRLEGDSKFTAYDVERKEGNGPFVRRNSTPFVNPNNPDDDKDDEVIVYMDSIPRNYTTYLYRVRGITAFGETSGWAEISVKGRDLTPTVAPASVAATYLLGGKQVKITWKMSKKESDLAGYVVGRSENYEGPYQPINDKLYAINDTIALDLKPMLHQRNFYLVSAIDTAGNSARSVPAYAVIVDSTPPAKPTGLTAKIDSLGVVKLAWDLGKEPDLESYNIYRANNPKEEFNVINQARVFDKQYVDMVDVNSLTKDAYYKIVAFDKAGNPSEYSAVVAVKKPDYIPPVPPQITDFWVEDNQVKLKFMPSNSPDLKEYNVYRKIDTAFQKIATLSKADSLFIDLKLPEKDVVWYTMTAVDSAGLISQQAFPQRITLPIKGVEAEPKLVVTKTDKGIVLSWDKDVKFPTGARIILYKGYDDAPLEQYKMLETTTADYTDTEIVGNRIRYAVRLRAGNGVLGKLSTIVEVKGTGK